jgi:DNA-binding NtrC family response regulator
MRRAFLRQWRARTMSSQTFLIVEDEALIRASICAFFKKRGYRVAEATGVAEAQRVFSEARPDAAVLDYQLPDGDGLVLMKALKALDASLPVVILTAHGSIDLAVRAIKEGAEQFLTKPVELPALLLILERLIEHRRNRQTRLAGRHREARQAIDPFAGESAVMRRLAEQAQRVASSSTSVLIQGESGTGKGLLASWLHRNGPRAEEAFVDLNCAGLSRDLLESELFGYQKGAFTGAVADKPGLLEIAHRGTLFLDEIGDADLQVQPKLLKVLEEQSFRRLGDLRDRQVDARLIAASHHDLRQMVHEHRFRDDLFYRISAIPLFVPPLRERGNDVIVLARLLLARVASELGCHGVRLSDEAERALLAYRWPGNVRELRNALERAVLLGDRTVVRASDFAEVVAPAHASAAPHARVSLNEAERQHIEHVLSAEKGDVRRAAATLGLSRSALYQKLKKHRISPAKAGS